MAIFGGFGSTGSPPGIGSTTTLPDAGPPEIPNPWEDPILWRAVLLNDLPSPGICVECAGSNPRKWDKKDGTGVTGATVTFNGEGLAEFSARIQLGWEGPTLPDRNEQWNAWDTWKLLLKPPTTKSPNALKIWYPNLDLLPVPISAVIVCGDGPKGPKQVADGVWEWEIPFMQFRKPKAASTTPTGAKKADQPDAIDQQINSLVGDLNKLA